MSFRGNRTRNKGDGSIIPPSPPWQYRLFINSRLRVQSIKGFRRDWFRDRKEMRANPNPDHIKALNSQLIGLQKDLMLEVSRIGRLLKSKAPVDIGKFKKFKHRIDVKIVFVQNLWDFFFDLFLQRKSIYGPFLDRCDEVVGECYRLVFTRLGKQMPWTRTPPLCYMEKAFSFATTRRGVRSLGKAPIPVGNVFPVIKIPYDRFASPWMLSSLIHEVSHDIHGDIQGFWKRTRVNIYKTLREKGFSRDVAATWSFWHKEIFADLLSILLNGPAVVHSLMDLISRPDSVVMMFRPNDSHPTHYLRVLVSTYALRKLGFSEEAGKMEREWKKRYQVSKGHRIPGEIISTVDRVIPLVVKTLLWTPYAELGGRRFVDIVNYSKKTHRRVLAGAGDLLIEKVPLNMPKRLLISSGVYAFQRRPEKARTIRKLILNALGRETGKGGKPSSDNKRMATVYIKGKVNSRTGALRLRNKLKAVIHRDSGSRA